MTYVARALEVDETRGFMKVVVDGDTDQILGAAVLGLEGGEVMSMLQIAMMGQATLHRAAGRRLRPPHAGRIPEQPLHAVRFVGIVQETRWPRLVAKPHEHLTRIETREADDSDEPRHCRQREQPLLPWPAMHEQGQCSHAQN